MNRLYASLCSETYKRSLDLREYGLFRRALLERDDAQVLRLISLMIPY